MNRRIILTRIVQGFTITGFAFLTYPFIRAWIPKFSQDLSLEVDLTDITPGQSKLVRWMGRNLYVHRRTLETIKKLAEASGNLKDPASENSQQPMFANNIYRSLKPDIFVTYSNCTHLGCEVILTEDVFKCPCHQSDYDLAGRVLEGAAAPVNLEIPSYRYLSGNMIRLEPMES